LRGQAEAAGGKRRLDLGLGEAAGERAALQALFERPGRLLGGPRLDNEKARGVEAFTQKAGAVGASPFPCFSPRQAPQDEPATFCQSLRDHRQGEAERRRRVAIGMGFDLVEAALKQRL